MRPHAFSTIGIGTLIVGLGAIACDRRGAAPPAPVSSTTGSPQVQSEPSDDTVKTLVGRLDLGKYKATISGLTRIGDRRQGTDRNRAAVDWIEAQLKSYGCTNTERVKYVYNPPAPSAERQPTGQAPTNPVIVSGEIRRGQGGARYRGIAIPTGVNTNPEAQPDRELREFNRQPMVPGPREEVYCTKIGDAHPGEMYILGAHMDGHGWGEAANDNGSGTALVMEVARVFSSPDVQTDRSIRFALWNNEETGYDGAHVACRAASRASGPGESRRLGAVSGAKMAWDDPARHDAFRSRDAASGRHDRIRSNDRKPTSMLNSNPRRRARMTR